MKWKNKGHEFDEVYNDMCQKTRFYLLGAGDYGHQFYDLMKGKIAFAGYIDNKPSLDGVLINGLLCEKLSKIKIDKETGIVVTMSQYERMSAVSMLDEMGLKENKDYFFIEDFISIYSAYKYNELCVANVSFLPSTACNLNCRYCLNFNPFSIKFYTRELDNLKKDVDLFFDCVDYIMLFHISGGETFLYSHIGELVEYIYSHYGNRIGKLRMVTNGTVIPSDDVLKHLAKVKVQITVDDYREAIPDSDSKFNAVIRKLEEFHINYYINKVNQWVDLGPDVMDLSSYTEEQLIKHREQCNQTWLELREGKLYSCNYAAYAVVTGKLGDQDEEETYDLKVYSKGKIRELLEFYLGYTEKGYTNFCKHCRGFSEGNTHIVKPAEQSQKRNMDFACTKKSKSFA